MIFFLLFVYICDASFDFYCCYVNLCFIFVFLMFVLSVLYCCFFLCDGMSSYYFRVFLDHFHMHTVGLVLALCFPFSLVIFFVLFSFLLNIMGMLCLLVVLILALIALYSLKCFSHSLDSAIV